MVEKRGNAFKLITYLQSDKMSLSQNALIMSSNIFCWRSLEYFAVIVDATLDTFLLKYVHLKDGRYEVKERFLYVQIFHQET